MGRPIKSTEDHIRDGTYRKSRHENRGVKMDTAESLEVPKSLNFYAREKWLEIIPELQEKGLIALVDIPTLTDAFMHYGTAQECIHTILEENESIASYLKNLNKFKDVNLYDQYSKDMDSYTNIMRKFGITPTDRAKIKIEKKKEDEADNFIKTLMATGA